METLGQRCAGASDPASCEQRAAETSDSGFPIGICYGDCTPTELLVTSGDDVTVLDSREELIDFLAPIDTRGEAELVVWTQEFGLPCEQSGTVPRDSGYDVLAFRYTQCAGETRFELHVDEQGTISALDEDVVSPDQCR
jgi:hypothetical protein